MEQITEINNTTNVEQEAQNEVMNGHNEVVMVESGEKTEFGEEEQEGEEERIKREQASQRRRKVDFSSKEEFPELGKPKAEKTIAPTTWGKSTGLAAAASKSAAGGAQRRGNQVTEVIDMPLGQIAPRAKGAKGSSGNQQKLTVAEVVKQIMAATRTTIEVSKAAQLNTMTFLIMGEAEGVSKAKREICSQLSPQITLVVQIPSVVRRFIVGTKGQTLMAIQTQTGTKITLPSRTEEEKEAARSGGDFEDDDLVEVVDVTIVGDVQGVGMAKAAIEEIVQKRTSKRGVRISTVPREHYLFIAGPNNQQINEWMKEFKDVRIRVPMVSVEDSKEEGVSRADANTIVVTGEREAVGQILARIEAQSMQLSRTLMTMQITLPKRQHRFVVGAKGATIQEILEKTGCGVEVPSSKSESVVVTVRGTQNRLAEGMAMVMEKANSVSIDTVDLSTTQGAKPNIELGWQILRFIQVKLVLKRLEKDHGVSVYVNKPRGSIKPTCQDDLVLELVGKSASSVAEARAELVELVRGFTPAYFETMEVEPHLQGHLVGRKGANAARMREKSSVMILTPVEPENLGNLKPARSSEVILAYEGHNPEVEKISDSKEKEKKIRAVLKGCKAELMKHVQEASEYANDVVSIPSKYHSVLIGAKGVALKEVLEQSGADSEENRVFIDFGSSSEDNNNNNNSTRGGVTADQMSVKGPKKIVEKVVSAIKKRVEELKHREVMYAFEEVVQVPERLLSRVIGKGGSGLNKISQTHDVQVTVGDKKEGSTLTIKGTKQGAAAAKAELEAIIEDLADQTVRVIVVDSQHHGSLIGPKGKYVRRLETKYHVNIRFPETEAETETEAGIEGGANEQVDGEKEKEEEKGTINRESERAKLQPNEILVRGGSKGVAAVCQELLDLAAYVSESNYSETVTVAAKHLRYVVGRGGAQINEIRDQTSTRIEIPNSHSATGAGTASENVEIQVRGSAANVQEAIKLISAVVADHESTAEVTVDIARKHHRALIGPSGSVSREIVAACGGNPELSAGRGSCKIFFPRNESTAVRVVGDQQVVDKVVAELTRRAAELDSIVTVSVEIPPSQHSQLIGKRGSNLRTLQTAHNVQINFPKSSTSSTVQISGLPDACAAASAALLALVRQESVVEVPLALHRRLVAARDHTRLWDDVAAKFAGVSVDSPRVDKPSRAYEAQLIALRSTPNELVDLSPHLIVDPESPVHLPTAEWVVRGSDKSAIAGAVSYIKAFLTSYCTTHAFATAIPVDRKHHRFIIGRGGSVIQAIREDTGAAIDVPKDADFVIILGSKDAIEAAKSKILDIVSSRT